MIRVDDLHVSTHQDVIANTYQILGGNHAMTAYHRIIANVNLRIGLRELGKRVILNGAVIANFQNSIVSQPKFCIVFNDYSASGLGQVFTRFVCDTSRCSNPPGLRYEARSG